MMMNPDLGGNAPPPGQRGGRGGGGRGAGGRGGGAPVNRGGGGRSGARGAGLNQAEGPAAGPGGARYPSYLRDRDVIEQFFKNYTHDIDDPNPANNNNNNNNQQQNKQNNNTNNLPYMEKIERIALRQDDAFIVSLDELCLYGQLECAERVAMNVVSYLEEIAEVVDNLLPVVDIPPERMDPIDYIAAEARAANQPLPKVLTRRYEVVVLPRTSLTAGMRAQNNTNPVGGAAGGTQDGGGGMMMLGGPGGAIVERVSGSRFGATGADKYTEAIPLRHLRASQIGTLCVIRGICVSATAVRPKLAVLTTVCEACTEATFQRVQGDRLTPQSVCTSARCRNSGTVGRLLPQYRASLFVKCRELRIQELPGDVPKGAIPRTLRVVCQGGHQTRVATPGQTISIVGTYIPDPGTGAGNAAFRASTMVRTMFMALHMELSKRSYDDAASDMQRSLDEVQKVPDRDAVIAKLTRSIAPEIFGLEDVKKILLCLLVGGCGQANKDGNSLDIRSDINICLMGDPGVAKSQLLKWIASATPRSVFTTGKGSSGVGLTASVTRDAQTGETVLEGGALVLADNGICCIDEFDKLDETDRTSLHEVMEQQTVSIAKAGIITTLNARTSILAAANPKFGRWRRHISPAENVNLPPALLSRFDLLWLLLDDPDRERDMELSMHVTHVHVYGTAPGRVEVGNEIGNDYYSRDLIRAYVGSVRRLNPTVDEAAVRIITDVYCAMRQQRGNGAVVTARTLLSLLRLSQSLARLRLSPLVQDRDVREAARLVEGSRASLQPRRGGQQGGGQGGAFGTQAPVNTPVGTFAAIKDLAKGRGQISLDEVRTALALRGVGEPLLQEALSLYGDLGVLALDASGANIILQE